MTPRVPGVLVPDECLERIRAILGYRDVERVGKRTRVRFAKDFLVSGILKILFIAAANELTFVQLFARCQIINRSTFNSYLQWMIDIGWITVDHDRILRVTEKGQFLLRAFT